MTAPHVLSPAARLSKLRAMSAAEIIHRLRYGGVIAIERRRHSVGRVAPPNRLRNALVGRLRTGDWEQQLVASRLANRDRFFCSVSERESVRALFATAYQRERAATLAHAARVRRHEFEFFGQRFNYDEEIEWQRDPITRRSWPTLYHADVPVHAGDAGYGDVKYVWELNRQQFLIDLGKAWFLGHDRENLHALQQLVRSWIAGNPYATGVNWSCALEPAFRVFSWLWAYFLTVEDLDEQFHLEWLRSFYDHGRFIERHLELYSSPYNHLIAEAAALYMLGTCFPEFRDAERWRRRGRSLLQNRLAEQFYGDGGSVEQSTFYHHATIGFYLLAAVLARAMRDDLPRDVWKAIERGLDFSMLLSQPDGKTPPIGGADDGKPIRMEHLQLWDFRPYQAVGAVLFNRGDFKRVAGRFHEDALWLLGPAGLAQFDALESHAPRETSASFVSSGYYVMRSNWSERADYLCFDCGEQAAGMRTDGVPNSMHGHADCLSVVAWLSGRRVLVDSGLYAYNCGGEWEAHFRETAAHNTAKVDGRDQATHIGKMAWSHSYRAIPEGWRRDAHQGWVVGSHDGYARGANGVVHRRAVWLRSDSYLLVYDEFVGTGEHDLTVHYQFAPGALERAGSHSIVFDDAVEMSWAGSQAWSSVVACGGPGPEDGWIAPSLGIRQAAPRITLRCTTARPRTTLLTVIAARLAPKKRVAMVATGHGTLALVGGTDYTDCVRADGLSESHPIDTDALLAVCRVCRDGTVETSGIGNSPIEVDASAVRRLCAPGLNAVTVGQ
jgi:hypothetical protein